MNRRLIAAALLAVLTILGGLDLLEDTGLIHYSTSEMDRTVEDVLDNYGEAIRSAESVPDHSVHPHPRDSGFRSNSQDWDSSITAGIVRRKRNLDFAQAFDPLQYSQVFLV